MTRTLTALLADTLSMVRDLVVYSDSLADARSRGLIIFSTLDATLTQAQDAGDVPKQERYALKLRGYQTWDDERQQYFNAPDRIIYFIDGFITESKILAIKEVRNNSKTATGEYMPLRDAKDFVDALALGPRLVNT